MKTAAIIQARTGSERLPGKVLKTLPHPDGPKVLEHVIRRAVRCGNLDAVIVATTVNPADEKIVRISEQEGVPAFRGSEEDLILRYHEAAREFGVDIVVRLTADNPCIDPGLIDLAVKEHMREGADYTSSHLSGTYPLGMSVEVFGMDVLEKAHSEAGTALQREHITPYMTGPAALRVLGLEAPEGLRRPDIRITLDTLEDYALLCAVFEYLYSDNPFFGTEEIVNLYERKPWLLLVNGHVRQKKKTPASLRDEHLEAVRVLDLQDLKTARDFLRDALEKGP